MLFQILFRFVITREEQFISKLISKLSYGFWVTAGNLGENLHVLSRKIGHFLRFSKKLDLSEIFSSIKFDDISGLIQL